MENKRLSLQEIQQVTLGILLEFDKLCRQYHLRYSLAYGTLIGAVRHKGFIPWDDDIDVVMPRGDYEKLLKIRYQSERYEIKNYNISDDYYYAFAKMVDKDTTVIDEGRCEKHIELFVDIFPMDFFVADSPNELIPYGKAGVRRQFFARTIGIAPFCYRRLRYCVRSVIKLALFPFRNKIFDNLNSLGSPEKESNYCSLVIHNDNFPEFFDANIWNNLIDVEFESHYFPVFSEYDSFLTTIYGDYMTPPPKEQQVSVHGLEAYMK
ncbi:MAG: LicD family protein [Eubacterium sp.]|nr:LicD family protein [Eubacterium sp.]